ncbi:PREDICTED: serine/threonine-protein phosphatase 1 regulatory subunit 10, partial [Aptenodytes forsteri]|uniref:serine/threonine-protein phosphatase 1 regulatory subunit 10 n=1 Tax=Aptenodytes forsteri TaxID=9233 RepID=UPI0004F4B069
MEGLGFLDALNSAPIPGIKIKKKKKVLSPSAAKVRSSAEASGDTKTTENPSESGQLTKKGRKKKTVSWPEESKLREYFYFELDETERVNVNKIKDFGEAAKREMLMDRQAFETARRLSHDAMEEKVPWVYPKLLDLPAPLVVPGSGSRERFTQAEREKGILQEIFLSKERIPTDLLLEAGQELHNLMAGGWEPRSRRQRGGGSPGPAGINGVGGLIAPG